MIPILTIIFLLLGLIIGSFLNVVIFRYQTQRFYGGRSICMSCHKTLPWYELIPLFSFLFLAGRCSKCKTKISIQYPIVELITGLVFAGLLLKFQDLFFLNTAVFSITMAFYATVFSVLIIIAVYDWRHKIIPDKLTWVLGFLAFLGLFFFDQSGFSIHWPSWNQFFAGFIISAPFALIWLVSKGKWMGLGDAKLAIGLGWLLGLSRVLSGVILAFWIGGVIGLFLISVHRKKHGWKSEIPLAPFLALGTTLAFLCELHIFSIGF